MNHLKNVLLIIAFAGILSSCGKSKEAVKENPSSIDEKVLLLNFIEKSGDLINTPKAPFTISADDLYEELSNSLVIDIRDTTDYYEGHIDGAVQVDARDLMNYLDEKVNASAYRNVVIACYSGQSSSYYATLLRLAGYSNVFTLRYGMAGWTNKISPNKILENLSNRYAGTLETRINKPEKKYDFPEIKTGETGGYGILLSRVRTLFEEGFGKAYIKIDSVVQHPDRFFVINYWPEESYNKGHLPGAIQFTPRESLIKDKMLAYLPADKPIAIYCSNGQQSASVAAYLRILGYNALSISFGSNGFMHGFMQANQISAFVPSEYIADYPVIEGRNPSLQSAPTVSNNTQTGEKETKPPVIKKRQKSSGGGC